jgi:membrane-bound hydrogenase subunit mbhJ
MNSGSCNGCDIELIASLTPRYDAEQLGVRLEGSPRHADILCITGPVTHNAVQAIKTVYGQVCGPKAVVAIGSCPATTNVFIDSRTLDGPLDRHIPVDVFVPGCPPRPDAIIQGIAAAAGILAERAAKRWPDESVMVPIAGAEGTCSCTKCDCVQADNSPAGAPAREVQP